MKAVVEVTASDDEDSYSRPVFKKRRKTTPEPTEHLASDGRVPSQRLPLPSPSPARDIREQKSRGENHQKGALWDPSLDATSFLEKTLLPVEVREELDNLKEDQRWSDYEATGAGLSRKLPRPLQAYEREGFG